MAIKRLEPGPTIIDIIRADLKKYIKGQDYAIYKVCNAIPVMLSGLRDRTGPLIIFLAGPQGIGKTRFFEVIAETMNRSLGCPSKKIDMGEFHSPHSIARIVGSEPGYVYGEPIVMPYEISDDFKRPSLLLLDEIEKAHPAVLEALLGALDKGQLTLQVDDPNSPPGYPVRLQLTISLSCTIIFMTSNVGSEELALKLSEGSTGQYL